MGKFSEPVVFIDIETSGSTYRNSRVIEIGALRVEDDRVVDTFKTLVNSGTPLPRWITELTGITDSDLVQAPYFDDIAYQLQEFLSDAVFCAHNVRFDFSFIKHELASAGYDYDPKLLCTVKLSRTLYPEHKGHSLDKLLARHNILVNARHRAYDDAGALKDFTDIAYAEKGADLFEAAVKKQFSHLSVPAKLPADQIRTIKNSPGVYIFQDDNGQPLYIGKSVKMRNRVQSHFRQDIHDKKEMSLATTVNQVETIETNNELEALLLESSMIKRFRPLRNVMLRPVRRYSVLRLITDENGYDRLRIEETSPEDLGAVSSIYGIYTSRAKAKNALETTSQTFNLCPKLLGLETPNSACFSYQLGKCRGACIGKEADSLYNTRLKLAFNKSKMSTWPYPSAVMLSDLTGNGIIVKNWTVCGYVSDAGSEFPQFQTSFQSFDLDTYRILRAYLPLTPEGYIAVPIDERAMRELASDTALV